MSRVIALVGTLFVLVMPAVTLYGQEEVRPVTVCEVLSHTKRFAGSPVAVLGRLYCPPSLENACWLTEDRCERPVVYEGRELPSKIWIEFISPQTLDVKVEINPVVLREKLSAICKRTKLGTHRVMLFKEKNGVLEPDGWRDQTDEWAIVYGRISINQGLLPYSGAPVSITRNSFQTLKDEDYAEQKARDEK